MAIPNISTIVAICQNQKNITIIYLTREETGVPKPPIANKESFNLERYSAIGDETGVLIRNKEDDSKSRFFPLPAILEISPGL